MFRRIRICPLRFLSSVSAQRRSASIANMNERFLGVYASVSTTGIIKTADAFKVEIKTKNELLNNLESATNNIKSGIIKFLS